VILENAVMSVRPGTEEQFLAALGRARSVLERADGFRGLVVHRGIERPSCFLLLITWDTLEDHTVGFRGGELFGQWRAILGPFFAEPPEVEHWAPVTPILA
jgi:heme-degrading monooxygenase HmoA